LAVVFGLILGGVLGAFVMVPLWHRKKLEEAARQAEKIKVEAEEKAKAESKHLVVEAKEEAMRLTREAERSLKDKQNEFSRRERNFYKMEEQLSRRIENLDRKTQENERQRQRLDAKEKSLDGEIAKIRAELERVSGMTSAEAKEILLRQVEEESRYDTAQLAREIEDTAKREATANARKIIVAAMARCTVDHYSDAIVTSVGLKNDEMKGRIIGREGRNIRALESLTGVDIIIDDTPGVVVISCFDPTLERLISDGRIHPAKIEEMVEKVKVEVDDVIWQAGQEATFQTGVSGVHPEIVKLLGKLKFRTSYGQNVLKHSIEVAYLSGVIAAELGLNPKISKRSGLLHDIGKAVDAEVEGTHQAIGMDLARKFGEGKAVVLAIGGHHGDIEQTIEAAIVQVADAISASRPGARGESLESYLQRLEKLEEIGQAFEGVDKCFAIQAGRELRVMVKPDKMDEVLTYDLCRKITKRIEEELEYPGMIKVTVIRETREVDFAK
jgi:ribonuclease Y